MPDVFDERFPEVVERAIANAAREWRDDPWCIGYFVDNELLTNFCGAVGVGTSSIATICPSAFWLMMGHCLQSGNSFGGFVPNTRY